MSIRLTQRGFSTIPSTGIIVFLSGNMVLSGSYNDLPKNMGGGKKMHFFRGNCAGSRPFVFENIEKAVGAIHQVSNASNYARFFIGNSWIGTMQNSELTMFEKPIKQLL